MYVKGSVARWVGKRFTSIDECNASGKPGDFSDSDRKCAENFGIDYLDVEDFVNDKY